MTGETLKGERYYNEYGDPLMCQCETCKHEWAFECGESQCTCCGAFFKCGESQCTCCGAFFKRKKPLEKP